MPEKKQLSLFDQREAITTSASPFMRSFLIINFWRRSDTLHRSLSKASCLKRHQSSFRTQLTLNKQSSKMSLENGACFLQIALYAMYLSFKNWLITMLTFCISVQRTLWKTFVSSCFRTSAFNINHQQVLRWRIVQQPSSFLDSDDFS